MTCRSYIIYGRTPYALERKPTIPARDFLKVKIRLGRYSLVYTLLKPSEAEFGLKNDPDSS